jgi:FKBP-type peptidyl-prolyl cis-trans isomerase FkpA
MRLRLGGAALLVIGSLLLAGSVACGGGGSPTDPSQNLNVPFSQTDLVVGTGRQATNGNRVTAHYTLWLYDPSKPDNKGAQLQTSVGLQPLQFTVGVNEVIRGWDQGVPGMAVGGKRRLVIPPSLAYGSEGRPPQIPPNATLVFELELLSIV